jgi:phage baseplate assembly protein W
MTTTGRHLSFPFRIASDGRTAAVASDSDHIRDEILQLLLTSEGERPFLPEFGGGARKLVFEPASDVLRGVVKARITGALTAWLGHRLTLEYLEVTMQGESIEIDIKYRPFGSTDSRTLRFQRHGK